MAVTVPRCLLTHVAHLSVICGCLVVDLLYLRQVVKLDCDSHPFLMNKYRVRGLPYTALFHDGKVCKLQCCRRMVLLDVRLCEHPRENSKRDTFLVSLAIFGGKEVVGFYFSAAWENYVNSCGD